MKPILVLLCLCLSFTTIYGQTEDSAQIPISDQPASDLSTSDQTTLDSVMATATADSTFLDRVQDGAESEVALEIEPLDVWSTGISSTSAVLMSPLFPGWGQLYTDNSWRAALAFGVETYYWANMLAADRKAVRYRQYAKTPGLDDYRQTYYHNQAEEQWERMRDWAWWSGGVMMILALDAYVGAHLFNFDKHPVSVPNEWDKHFESPGQDMPGSVQTPTMIIFQHQIRF